VGSDGGGDGVGYAFVGKNLFSGKGLSLRGGPELIHPPFYPILIGLFWFFTHNLEYSGQMVSIIATALLVIPIYYLAKQMYGRKVALVCAGFTIVFPPLVYGSTEIRCEPLYTWLLMSSVALNWQTLRSTNIFWASLTGLMIGLAYLTHSIGIIFIPIFIIFLLFSRFFISRPTKKLILAKVVLLLASFIIVSLPYWVFLHRHTGKWLISGNTAYIQFSEAHLSGGNLEKDSFIFSEEPSWVKYKSSRFSQSEGGVVRFAISHPGKLFRVVIKNFFSIYPKIVENAERLRISSSLVKALLLFILSIILVGLFKSIWDRRFTGKEFYLMVILFSSSVFLLFHIEPRYFFPYLPILILGLAKVTVEIESWLGRKFLNLNRIFSPLGGFIIPGILILGMSIPSAHLILRKKSIVPYEYKIIGQWMKENLENISDSLVMSRKAGVPFYAGSKWNPLYYGEYAELIKYARSKRIDYLVIDEYTIPRLRPRLIFLLDPSKDHPGLEVVHVVQYRGRKIILYRLSRSY
jgi:4-amino-4-deoxy-L-arabinose transferase-like glycosyltransferase